MSNTRSNNPRLTPRGKGNRNPDNWTRGWETTVLDEGWITDCFDAVGITF